MTNRNNNRNQPHTGGKANFDTEFSTDQNMSKKARKKAARDNKKNK